MRMGAWAVKFPKVLGKNIRNSWVVIHHTVVWQRGNIKNRPVTISVLTFVFDTTPKIVSRF